MAQDIGDEIDRPWTNIDLTSEQELMQEYAKGHGANERLAIEKKAHERTRYLLDSTNYILELMATGTI